MEKRFIIPAVTFLGGIFIWLAFFGVYLSKTWIQTRAPWVELGFCLVVGVLVFFSAVACTRAGGPSMGSKARSGALLIMALLTFWKVGEFAAGLLLVAALATGARAFIGSGGSTPASEQSTE